MADQVHNSPPGEAVWLMLQVGEIADEILEASIDPRGLCASDILDDDQSALLHVKTVEILQDRISAAFTHTAA